MGKISDNYANNLLDVAFGSAVSTFPANFYLGLSTTQPADNGTNISEPSGGSYDRVAMANDDVTWGPAALRATTNLVLVTFPTATGDWGTITHFVLMDGAYTSDPEAPPTQMVAWGALGTPLTVGIGAVVTFDPSSLVITAPGT